MAPMAMTSLKRGKTRFRDLFEVSAKSPEEVTYSECKIFYKSLNLKCKKTLNALNVKYNYWLGKNATLLLNNPDREMRTV